MRQYKNKITLAKNNRGCYILDTVKGCSCAKENPSGCYGDCYAKNISSRYGFDFSSPVNRGFEYEKDQLYLFDFYDTRHESRIIKKIKSPEVGFVRIGEMGDPSEDWEHTLHICSIVSLAKKPIVIITKHWKSIPKKLLPVVKGLRLHINTSISALDNDCEISYRLFQYNMLKKYCNSILRIVSCDFNKENPEGLMRSKIQDELFRNEKTIDTIFRPSPNNPYVTNGIINVKKIKFLKSEVLASVYRENTYFGRCEFCHEMCGINFA